MEMPRASDWLALGTATISDALDRLGLSGTCLGVAPIARGMEVAGPAFTVRMAPAAGGTVGDFIDEVPAGAVVVIDNRGRLTETVWGGLLTAAAAGRGVAGTVIDGVCRDSGEIVDAGYPLFSRGRFMRTGKNRVQLEATGEVVEVAGTRAAPGDWVIGDADGVVVVPRVRCVEVATVAREIARAERAIGEAVAAGESLVAARRRFAYHSLQGSAGEVADG